MNRLEALTFLTNERDKLAYRLECAEKVPCRVYYEQIESAYTQAIFAMRDNADLRNELCLKCGKYKKAHEGSCDGCRWKKGE